MWEDGVTILKLGETERPSLV